MIKRNKTRQVRIGSVKVGGLAPISIQSMTKTETADIKATVSQIRLLEDAGCEIVRVAVKNFEDAAAVKVIKKKIRIPLVCDIHFDYKLALAVIANGADKIRLNPGNIRKGTEITAVVKAAKDARIPIRIGVNSGSVANGQGKKLPERLVNSAMGYIKRFEDMDFRDIIISLKASDVVSTIEAYRKMSGICDYPLHLGITAAGPYDAGIVKSSIGIGTLLLDGIGDTVRVSLTANPVDEVRAAKKILGSLNIRRFGPDIISCPTCGRCQTDIVGIVRELERRLLAIGASALLSTDPELCRRIGLRLSAKRPIKIAVMGCEVNGPGEAREADIGIAAGKGSGVLFVKGRIIKRIKESDFVKEIIRLVTADSQQEYD